MAELFHTERSHVRKLKVLNLFFYKPLKKEGNLMPPELLDRLFCNLEEVLEVHKEYNEKMKDRIKASGWATNTPNPQSSGTNRTGKPIGNIGDILQLMVRSLQLFDLDTFIFCLLIH